MHFVPWWTAPPTIVAEALTAVPDPLFTALRPGPAASGASVAVSIARSLLPAEDDAPAPAWLLDGQQLSFRRTLAAVRRYQGAVLADPVGSGKTYIALAVAAAVNQGKVTGCLAPATLLSQWEAAAKLVGIPLALCSHQQASRGALPQATRGLVIVDESHHFRNRMTKRYAYVANWLVGRPALLVTATPIVNRLSDLGNQLLLAVRDNALIIDGIPSLRDLFASNQPHPALGQLVIENEGAADGRPRKIARISHPTDEECAALSDTTELIGRLCLSRIQPIAALIRGVLLRAASSSPAALAGSLQRYKRLLLHARDALRSGHALDRSELRRFTAELGDQLIWWELLPVGEGSGDLELADLRVLDDVIPAAVAAVAADDSKLHRLREILAQDRPTLVFTASRDTVRYIRERLSGLHLAWCTGDKAGIGHTTLPREAVLGWFRDGAPCGPAPRHLIVTDVAAEGLDLQRASRVVHYDLPWTPMRLEQREGRSVRLGSRHLEVEAVRFACSPSLERSLRLEASLARKTALPAAAGLGERGRHIWRWRADVNQALHGSEAIAGVASIPSDHRGLLAGIALHRPAGREVCLSAAVGWLDPSGGWSEDAEIITQRLLEAAAVNQQRVVGGAELRTYLELLTPVIRKRLALTHGRKWLTPHCTPAVAIIAARLGGLIREAARLRHESRLTQLERGLAFVAGGHTAGEEMMLDRLVDGTDRDLTARLSRVMPQPDWDGIEVRLTGLIVYGPSREELSC
jgi:superfamily II DNA or RNA helicase